MKTWIIRPFVVSACVGVSIALLFAVFWRLVNFDYISISNEARDTMSGLTLLLCPSSFVLMEVGPREAITSEVAMLYAEVILMNGMLYGLLISLGVALLRVMKKSANGTEG
jgi:hypothetical protein